MRLACIQTNPQTNVNENISIVFDYILQAAQSGAELVVLPEMFTYMGNESLRKNTKNDINEGIFLQLKNIACELKINLVAGTHSEAIKNNLNKVYNTAVTYNKTGEMISIYRKLHLFNLKDKEGKSLYCESDSFAEGNPPEIYQLEDWKALNIICYDIRFPEIIRRLNSPIDILFVPAAFTWQTGKDHWEVLLRVRAIENQCYVVACNQTGYHTNNQKRNYGNSMVIDPWGNIVARMGEECGILMADIDKKIVIENRFRLPALADRKLF